MSFCDPEERSLAVFDSMQLASDPAALGTDAIIADSEFTEHWPCGFGWPVSTDDRQVGLFLYQRIETDFTPGVEITLPEEAWMAEIVVGKHLFFNHCDDVFEPGRRIPSSLPGGSSVAPC